MGLRNYQSEAQDASLARFDAGIIRQVVQLPTGMGKTPLFSTIPEKFGFKGFARMMVLVHRDELATQAAKKLREWNPGLKVGIEMGNKRAEDDDIFVVASVQTIGRKDSPRLLKFDPEQFAAVVVDECHHAIEDNKSYMTVFEHFKFFDEGTVRLLLGVTATPQRGDGKALGGVFQEIVYSYPIERGIKEGWLADVRAIRVTSTTSLDGVKSAKGDFKLGELSRTVNTPERNALIVKSYLEHAIGRQTVVFCADIQHAQDVAAWFNNNGIKAEAIWGDDPDRAKKLERHQNGEIQVLCNCQVLIEGYDDWRVACIIMGSPTKSQSKFVQCVGRGTRIPPFPNGISLVEARALGLKIPKDNCLVIDVVDSTKKHSLVTLPTLLGLNKDMDLKGKSVLEAAEELEEAKKKNPNVDFSKVTDLSKIQATVEMANLFDYKTPSELEGVTELCWQKVGDVFVLNVNFNEKIRVFPMQNGEFMHWSVEGTVEHNSFKQDRFRDAQEGIRFAERMLDTLGRKYVRNLKAEFKTGGEKASQEQWGMLKKFFKHRPSVLNSLPEDLTKQQAQNLIRKAIAQRFSGRPY